MRGHHGRRAVAGVATGDPYWAYVKALLTFDGADGSTTITDVCGHTFTVNGTTTLSTSAQQFGTASLKIPTSSGAASISCTSSDFGFGSGDWTIEHWFNNQHFGGPALDFRTSSSDLAIAMYLANSNCFVSILDGTPGAHRPISASPAITGSTWYHVALCKAAGKMRFFLNGTQSGSTYTDNNTYISTPKLTIGASFDGITSGGCQAFYDEFRLTVGVGRYAANFTPSPTAFLTHG